MSALLEFDFSDSTDWKECPAGTCGTNDHDYQGNSRIANGVFEVRNPAGSTTIGAGDYLYYELPAPIDPTTTDFQLTYKLTKGSGSNGGNSPGNGEKIFLSSNLDDFWSSWNNSEGSQFSWALYNGYTYMQNQNEGG